MAISTRLIKRRIKSVKNTGKITKAMELVAASKMRKAIASVLASRPYAGLSWEAVTAISRITDTTVHPLLRQPKKKTGRVLLVVISSDRGLCGGFNSRLLRQTLEFVRTNSTAGIDTIAIGKKGINALRRQKTNLIATFADLTNNPQYREIKPIAKMIQDDFVSGKYDRVVLAYTDFVSAITQTPRVLELLPLSRVVRELVGQISERTSEKESAFGPIGSEFKFEPTPRDVLDRLLPRVVEVMLWQALLESAASEHSARMLAMRNATDAATDMVNALTLTFNQARQAGITREIAEISSGKAALE